MQFQITYFAMNCPNCSSMLEMYSLEYKWNGSIMEPRAWHYCNRCHQIWIISDVQHNKTFEGSELGIKKP